MFEHEVSNRIPILYALSTCPRCQRMKTFLEERAVEAVVVDFDLLSPNEKSRHMEFLGQVNPSLSFPTLVVGDLAVLGEDYESAREVLSL